MRNSDRKCNQVGPPLQRVLELEHGAEAEQDGLYQLHAAFVRNVRILPRSFRSFDRQAAKKLQQERLLSSLSSPLCTIEALLANNERKEADIEFDTCAWWLWHQSCA